MRPRWAPSTSGDPKVRPKRVDVLGQTLPHHTLRCEGVAVAPRVSDLRLYVKLYGTRRLLALRRLAPLGRLHQD